MVSGAGKNPEKSCYKRGVQRHKTKMKNRHHAPASPRSTVERGGHLNFCLRLAVLPMNRSAEHRLGVFLKPNPNRPRRCSALRFGLVQGFKGRKWFRGILADNQQPAPIGQMRTGECRAVGVDRILPGASRILRCGIVNKLFAFREGWTANVQGAGAQCGKKLKSWDLK